MNGKWKNQLSLNWVPSFTETLEENKKGRRGETRSEDMTMTTIPESLNSPVSGKNVFMEFGPPSQQMSPSSMSHGHYSMHCLHSAGHPQHDSSYSPASSFPRSLAYPYVNSVGSHSSSPYLSSVQTYQNSTALAQTRLDDAGKKCFPFAVISYTTISSYLFLFRVCLTVLDWSKPDVCGY